MIATVPRPTAAGSAIPWHAGFLKLLPGIVRFAQRAARRLRAEAGDELVQEVIAHSAVAYARLYALGRVGLAYPTVLARYGVAQARSGRRVGNRLNVNDVLSEYAQRRKRFSVSRLDRFDRHGNAWKAIAVENRRTTPAEIAILRVDFADWLRTLSPRKAAVAHTLAAGESTGAAARRFAITPGRVSQLRRELESSWNAFHAGGDKDVSDRT